MTGAPQALNTDIARIILANGISPASVNNEAGETLPAFFVMLASLRHKDADRQSISFLSRMFEQKLLMVLEYGQKQCLAI